MDCPLCNTPNNENATLCYICDTSLAEDPFRLAGQNSSKKVKKALFVGLSIFLFMGALFPWVMRQNTFHIPKEVSLSRDGFEVLKARYYENSETWNKKLYGLLEQIKTQESPIPFAKESTSYSHLPLEIFMAYLIQELDWESFSDANLSFYPLEEVDGTIRLILSKPEKDVGLYQPILSLEIDLIQQENELQILFSSLKRGEEELEIELADELFKEELHSLAKLEFFLEGVHDLHLDTKKATAVIDTPSISWKQHPRTLRPS